MKTIRDEIPLIVVKTDQGDGKRAEFVPTFAKETATVESLSRQIGSCLQGLEKVFEKSTASTISGWSIVSVTVGLAITASGTVGVVTVGGEASIEIQFAPKKSN
jgi:Trypsin-co-occurring domain 1